MEESRKSGVLRREPQIENRLRLRGNRRFGEGIEMTRDFPRVALWSCFVDPFIGICLPSRLHCIETRHRWDGSLGRHCEQSRREIPHFV